MPGITVDALARGYLQLPEGVVLTPARVRPHIMLMVNALVDNAEFDSQSKERLTTPPSAFGSACVLPASFGPLVGMLRRSAEVQVSRVMGRLLDIQALWLTALWRDGVVEGPAVTAAFGFVQMMKGLRTRYVRLRQPGNAQVQWLCALVCSWHQSFSAFGCTLRAAAELRRLVRQKSEALSTPCSRRCRKLHRTCHA